MVTLVRAGNPRPSAAEIAAAAGTGTRTVFRRFRDMEELFGAVSDRVQSEIMPLIDPSPIEGALHDRVAELVGRRARLYERLGPFRLSGMPLQGMSAVIREGARSLDAFHRGQLEATFAPELEGAPRELVEVLDVLTSFEAWHRLRTTQRLGVARASGVTARALSGLLTRGGRSH